jgi:hypothetical protein
LSQAKIHDAMFGCAWRFDDSIGRNQFGAMPLPIIKGQAIGCETLATGNRQTGGGIESTGKEYDGFLHGAEI